jgi:formylmethanofuran dehydrogenase subunit C
VITITLRAPLDQRIEMDAVRPDRFPGLGERDIAHLPIWAGRRAVRLGEFFDVRGGHSARVRVEGDLRQVDGLGAGTAGGEMIVEASVGSRCGAGMSGGRIEVRGNAGDECGLAMAGGVLRVVGNAGDRVGAATAGAAKGMSGGEIVVTGSVGNEAGARMRRGLVVVAGASGGDAARAMIAGTLLLIGAAGARPGRGSKRGSIVALDGIDIPPTYRYVCTYQPPHVRLFLLHLRRTHGLALDDDALNGRFRRYSGDAAEIGAGEILALAG